MSDADFETLRPHILRHEWSPLYKRAKGRKMGSSTRRGAMPREWARQIEESTGTELKERGIPLPWWLRLRRWWFGWDKGST